MNRIAHVLSFVGRGGGVQVSFRSYYASVRDDPTFHHRVFGTFPLSPDYREIDRFDNIRGTWAAKGRFLQDLLSARAVVHFYNYLGSQTVAKLLAVLPGRRIITHERGASWNLPDSAATWARSNADHSDVVLANSNAAKTLISKRWGIPSDKIEVIYNGVLPRNVPPAASTRSSSGDEFVVGYIGRLDSPKGVFSLIEAAAALRGRPEIRFVIVGEGVLREELERLATDLGVGERVHFAGGTREPYQVISCFDVLVIPSIREPLGNVAIEAGALAKPVIASSVDGLPEVLGDSGIILQPQRPLRRIRTRGCVPYPEVVVDPTSGRLVPPKELDPAELAEAISTVADDESMRLELGQRLSERVFRLFTVETYSRKMNRIYQRLLLNS